MGEGQSLPLPHKPSYRLPESLRYLSQRHRRWNGLFKKRQKEMVRVEKQRDKAARRAQKKEGDRPSGPDVLSRAEATALCSL